MFDTTDREELNETLSAFHVAMCAVEVTASGDLVYVGHNDLLNAMIGVDSKDMIDKPFDRFFSKHQAQRVSANYRKCFQTRRPVHGEVDVTLPGGQMTLCSTVVPVLDRDGGMVRVVGNAVGRKVCEDTRYEQLLDELTRLSAEGVASLYDAQRAIELRRDSGDLSPEEERFLSVFGHLSARALEQSLRIREKLCTRGHPHRCEDQLLGDSALSRAIEDLTGLG